MNRIEKFALTIDEMKACNWGKDTPPQIIKFLHELTDSAENVLAKLELAERTLESIAVPMPGSRDNQLVLYYERKAAETLKAIRE